MTDQLLVARELKGELARIHPARRCCRRAELAGLLYAGGDGRGIRTLDHATARIAVALATTVGIKTAAERTAPPGAPGRHHLRIALDTRQLAGWDWAARTCDRRAFVRGLLLASSISFGAGGPHLELVLRARSRAVELRTRLRELGVWSGIIARRGRHVVYVKGQEQLATLLQLAGANRALLDLESTRVAREVRNRLNRVLNAEEANLGRTVRAADRQLRAIAELAIGGELEQLPEGLREAAAQRQRQPDADLDALAVSLGISRSAANHRLRRLVALAAARQGSEDA